MWPIASSMSRDSSPHKKRTGSSSRGSIRLRADALKSIQHETHDVSSGLARHRLQRPFARDVTGHNPLRLDILRIEPYGLVQHDVSLLSILNGDMHLRFDAIFNG